MIFKRETQGFQLYSDTEGSLDMTLTVPLSATKILVPVILAWIKVFIIIISIFLPFYFHCNLRITSFFTFLHETLYQKQHYQHLPSVLISLHSQSRIFLHSYSFNTLSKTSLLASSFRSTFTAILESLHSYTLSKTCLGEPSVAHSNHSYSCHLPELSYK